MGQAVRGCFLLGHNSDLSTIPL